MSVGLIKLIAFDLDGTLLDSAPDLAVAVDLAMQAMHCPGVSEAQVRTWLGNGADNLVARALSQNMTIDPSISEQSKRQARVHFDHYYAQCGHSKSTLYPQVKESLQALLEEGFQLAIITNKPYQFVPDILSQHGIDDLFVDVLGGDSLPKIKPDPMPLIHLLDKYQLTADEMIMIGDSKNDILAAKNAGVVSVALPYGYNHGEPIELANPDHLIDDLSQLLKLLTHL
ncbi:phosphoglycolate phosphatase [Vibrio sp. UCD-FRSSP16_10]|uniref:phosphoglycolate phosphatase n=1 Tax=unclassified Vibrio TaxID=2614977 RepID=UPI0007FBA71B|nr:MULTISPECIES: phosphoglycolate phosphatase [unclassified Vibrio]OBT10065.1 phosphoglycolate phosphatase [Vibrio sp. UCD-FRSSP16_30]OBT18855.1 phosphoglycolate phosphatase [Vibrio sp. UCD-FRSSP16_10]